MACLGGKCPNTRPNYFESKGSAVKSRFSTLGGTDCLSRNARQTSNELMLLLKRKLMTVARRRRGANGRHGVGVRRPHRASGNCG